MSNNGSPVVVNARFAGMRMTGVPRSAYEIVSRLTLGEGERYRLVSPEFEGEGALPVEQRGHIRQGHLWEQFELPRITSKTGKNPVLYSPMTSGPLAVTRQVMTVHDLFIVENPEWYSKAFSAWYRWLIPRLVRRVAYVIANSEFTRRRVLDLYRLPEEKVVLCRFAQNEQFAPVSEEEITRFRVDQELPERYLLFVGSVEPRKNLATLVAAWKRTLARERGVELVIAGGAGRKAVFNAANSGADALSDPTIRQLGFFFDEHLPLLYQGAEALALPSLAEGFGLTILEAMACGTPVICSDTTAMPETAGSAARLVPALEVEAWTEALDQVLSDPELRSRLRSAGLRRAADFSWSKTTAAVRNVLDAV